MQRLAPLNATVGPTYFVALRIALAAASGTTIQPRLPTRSTASVSRITTPALTGPPRLYVCRPNAPARSLSCRQPLPRRRSPEPDSPPQSVHPHAAGSAAPTLTEPARRTAQARQRRGKLGVFGTRGGLATAAQPPSTYPIGSIGYIGLPLKRDNLNEIRDIKNPNWTASPA